jgi:hypothetical protein
MRATFEMLHLIAIALATLPVPHDGREHGSFGRSGFAMMPHMIFEAPFGHVQGFRDGEPGQEQGNPFFDSSGRPYGNPFGDYALGGASTNHQWL